MATTFTTQQADCQGALADTTSDTLTRIKRAINRAQSDFWYAKPWNFRRSTQFVSTVAVYTTGTVTVTNGSATVTGSGTTFPTMTASARKFALTYQGPWYTILSRDSATQLTLDRNYVEDTASGQSYVVYQDVYSCASTAAQILSAEMMLHSTTNRQLIGIKRHEAETAWPLPSGAGTPRWWSQHDMSSGVLRFRVGEMVPETAFSIRLGVLLHVTDLSADGDESGVPERWRHIITYGALRELYLLYNRPDLSAQQAAMFGAGIEKAWMDQQVEVPNSGDIATIDQPTSTTWHQIVLPVS